LRLQINGVDPFAFGPRSMHGVLPYTARLNG
jgi:hypothetical protein